MSADAWFTLAVVVVTLLLLASERISAPLVVVGAVTVLRRAQGSDADGALSARCDEQPDSINPWDE